MTLDRDAIAARAQLLLDDYHYGEEGRRSDGLEQLLGKDVPAMLSALDACQRDLAAANETVARLRTALEVYAVRDSWGYATLVDGTSSPWHDLWLGSGCDGYDVARLALGAAEEGETA